jgi:hypothetical protein
MRGKRFQMRRTGWSNGLPNIRHAICTTLYAKFLPTPIERQTMRTLILSLTFAAAALVGSVATPSSASAQTGRNYTRPQFQYIDPGMNYFYTPTPGAPISPNGAEHFYGTTWYNGGYSNGVYNNRFNSGQYYGPRNYYNDRRWR